MVKAIGRQWNLPPRSKALISSGANPMIIQREGRYDAPTTPREAHNEKRDIADAADEETCAVTDDKSAATEKVNNVSLLVFEDGHVLAAQTSESGENADPKNLKTVPVDSKNSAADEIDEDGDSLGNEQTASETVSEYTILTVAAISDEASYAEEASQEVGKSASETESGEKAPVGKKQPESAKKARRPALPLFGIGGSPKGTTETPVTAGAAPKAKAKTSTLKMARAATFPRGLPTISKSKLNQNSDGSISGCIRDSPSFNNSSPNTTPALAGAASSKAVVRAKSGSRYSLEEEDKDVGGGRGVGGISDEAGDVEGATLEACNASNDELTVSKESGDTDGIAIHYIEPTNYSNVSIEVPYGGTIEIRNEVEETKNEEKFPMLLGNPACFQSTEKDEEKNSEIDKEESPTPASVRPLTPLSIQHQEDVEKDLPEPGQKASTRVVIRDTCVTLFDMAGDWTYYIYSVTHGGNAAIRKHALYYIMMNLVMAVAILGSLISLWSLATSLRRKRRVQSLCFSCTVPRLFMSLVLMHHVPMFVLTTFIDLTLLRSLSAVGLLNICSSMFALINTLAATKCGEGYHAEDETVMSDYDEPVTEYEAMFDGSSGQGYHAEHVKQWLNMKQWLSMKPEAMAFV